MELLELELESRRAQSERKILFALKLADEEGRACTYTELLQTGVSSPTLSARLDDLESQGLVTRTPIIKENEWPPSVYYGLTLKGKAEFLKRQIMVHVANGKTETKKFNSLYLHLVVTLRGLFFKKEISKAWWKKFLSLVPEILRGKLDILDYEDLDAFMKATKKASIITDCLDIFVYTEKPFSFNSTFWLHAYEWITELFGEKLDKPEEMGTYVVAIMFDGEKAKRLNETRSEIGCLHDYYKRIGGVFLPSEETKKEKPPKPSCFEDLRKLSDDEPIPEQCLVCDWKLECIGVL